MRNVKWFFSGIFVLLLSVVAFPQQLKLGKNPSIVEKSAVLELQSDNQGLLFSRINDTTLINAMSVPDGMVIFHPPSLQLLLRTGGHWKPLTVTAALAGYWSLMGNSGSNSGTNFLGTSDLRSFTMRTNNIQSLFLDSVGNIGAGSAPVFTSGTNREKFLVDAGTTNSFNVISGKGSIDNYLQLNIQNRSSGTSASSDLVASADNATESINFIDFGINSSGFTNASSPILGGINNAYLYSTGNDFIIGNATASKNLRLFTGGYANTNERMRIDGNGNVGIGTTSPTAYLHLKAGTASAGTSPLKFTSGSLLTTAEAGGMEFLTDKYYGTITTGAARKEFTLNEGSLTSGRIAFANASGRLRDSSTLSYSAGRLSPTYLTLAAGTATAGTAPLVMTSGVKLTTPQAGAVEFDGTHFFGTIGSTRYQLDQQAPNTTGTNTGDQTITLTGDVTGSGTGSFPATIGANVVTYAKMQQVAASKLLGNPTGSLANVSEIALGTGLSFVGSTLTYTPATSGTVTSVGLSLPSIFSVSNSPVTSSGTLTGTLNTQLANLVFAGPASGAAAVPAFRSLAAADLPLATTTAVGGISVGTGLSVTAGVLSTISAAPSGAAGGDLTGTYPNPTLTTVNSNTGTFGSTTVVPQITVNGKGLITAVAPQTIAFPVTSVNTLTGAVSLGIANMNDATITTPANNQVLQYNGTRWVNTTPSYISSAITSLNGLTAATQTFATPGTSGTAPAWSSTGSAHTLNIPLASAASVTAGLLSNTDWTTFNNKLSSVDTTNISNFYIKSRSLLSAGAGITYNSGTGVIANSGVLSVNGNAGALTMDTTYISSFSQKARSLFGGTAPITYANGQIGITQASTSADGYLSSTDWNTFNSKASPANVWSLFGNSGTVSGTNFLGTTDLKSFKMRTNNSQVMLLDSLGNVAIGPSPGFTSGVNREKLLVDAGTTGSFNVISGKGSINNYLQLNIQNKSSGSNASSDIVATADNGDEINNYVDLGINSSGNTSGYGAANDAYLYNTGQNFFIGTGTPNKSVLFMIGGGQSSNEKMRIDGGGNVGIGTTSPTNKLSVMGTNPLYLGGVQTGATSDSLLMITNGLVRKLNTSALTSLSVTSVGLSLPSIFSVSGSPVTSTGTLSATLSNQAANQFFAGPATGSATVPAFRSLDPADLPIATTTTLGSVSIGTGLAVTAAGVLSTASAAPSGAAGGDLTGTYPNPTLATVNTNTGTFGSTTVVPQITVNGKGLITGVSAQTIAFPVTSVNTLTGAVSLGISSMNDATITSPANNQILRYNGTKWVNTTPSYISSAITSLNGLTAATQTFATPGTSGTAPAWNSTGTAHTLNIPLASAASVTAGLLSNTDWNTFNNKLSTVDTTNISNFYVKSRSLLSAGTGINYNSGTGVIGNAGVLSVNGNAGALTMDTTYISNFSQKTRSLFGGTAPITYANGQVGITQAGTSTNGYLSSTDWNTFNNKLGSVTSGNLTETSSSVLTITGGTGAVLGSGTTLQVKQANGSQGGFLSSTDWTTFNNKLSTVDTTNISNFYVKSRSLLSAGTGITYNAATGVISSSVSTANSWAYNGNTVGAIKNFGTIDNYALPFITNNTEKMRLTTAGYLGIGNTAPGNYLDVSGTVAGTGVSGLRLNGLGAATAGAANAKVLSVNSTGDVIVTTNPAASLWSFTGNSGLNPPTNFLGMTDDKQMVLKSNNVSFLEFGRRQTLGLNDGFTDYNDNDEKVTYMRSAIQFEAPAANFYKPKIFTDVNGNFRIKGSSAGTDYFEMGSTGTSNNGGFEFIIGDDGDEPMVFKSYNYQTGMSEIMRLQSGRMAVGSNAFDATNPEKLLIDAGATNSYNLMTGKGSIDNYLQINVKNSSATANASSDLVASSDNGSETVNFIDMGINSSAYSNTGSPILNGANNAYLYATGNDFVLGNATASKNMTFFTGGTALANERMRIDGSGNVGIGVTSPLHKLSVAGTNPLYLAGVQNGSISDSLLMITGGVVRKLSVSALTSAAVTSVGLSLPSIFNVTGSPITTTGTLTGTLVAQSPNQFFAGPASGAAAATPAFRALTAADLPAGTANTSNTWTTNGNSGTASGTNYLGTSNLQSLVLRTNGIQGLILDSLGSIGVGSAPIFTAAPNREEFLVDAGINVSNDFINAISGKGTTNNYLQMNIQNRSNGTLASSDVVASNNTGSESTNYIDMGINSTGNTTTGMLGGNNTAYLYSTGADFSIGNSSANPLRFFTGGTAVGNERMRIDANGLVGIGTTTPAEKLDVAGNIKISGGNRRLSFATPAGDPDAAIESRLYSGTEGNELLLYQGNDNATAYGPDRIRMVSEEFRIQGFKSANGSLATAETETGTVDKMVIDANGAMVVGTGTLDATNPEQLLVDMGTASSINVISGKGNINNYLQLNIQNKSNGAVASSDVVATNDLGTEANGLNFIDMGVNSSGNTSTGVLGGANTAYLYSTGANLVIGNGTGSKDVVFFTTVGSTSTERMRLNTSGLIPGGNGAHTLGSSANRWSTVYAANGTVQTSDRREKTNITDLQYGLKEILALRPVSYNWKKTPDSDKMLGLIAQEAKQIVPEVVMGDEKKEMLGMKYNELVPVLINAIKEQQKQIDDLKQQILKLKK